MNKDQSVSKLIIGPLPPPIGGVATHISRYATSHGIPVFDERYIRSITKVKELLLLKETDIYIHSSSYYFTLLLILKRKLIMRECKYFFVNHNFQPICNYHNKFKYRLLHFLHYNLIRSCQAIYAVSQEIIDKMESIYGEATYVLLDPFVPPDISSEKKIIESYDTGLFKFLDEHETIICSGAWQISMHNGEDLYGFDLLIELIARIKVTANNIGLVFFIGNPEYNKSYITECINRIVIAGISNNIHIVTGQKEFWPIIKRADLFIRATNTDGDPISIKEALFFHTPVLASDCVKRIDGVELFISRNIDSLESQTKKIIKNMEVSTKKIRK